MDRPSIARAYGLGLPPAERPPESVPRRGKNANFTTQFVAEETRLDCGAVAEVCPDRDAASPDIDSEFVKMTTPECSYTYSAQVLDRSGGHYAGQFVRRRERKTALENGFGVYKSADGKFTYQGQWSSGEITGCGTMTLEAGIYRGEVRNGCMHGQGVWEYTNGVRYQGGFEADAFEGPGVYLTSAEKSDKGGGEKTYGLYSESRLVSGMAAEEFAGEFYAANNACVLKAREAAVDALKAAARAELRTTVVVDQSVSPPGIIVGGRKLPVQWISDPSALKGKLTVVRADPLVQGHVLLADGSEFQNPPRAVSDSLETVDDLGDLWKLTTRGDRQKRYCDRERRLPKKERPVFSSSWQRSKDTQVEDWVYNPSTAKRAAALRTYTDELSGILREAGQQNPAVGWRAKHKEVINGMKERNGM